MIWQNAEVMENIFSQNNSTTQTPDNQTMSKCECADKALNFIAELRGCTEESLTYLNGYEKRFYVKHVCKEMEEIEEAIVELLHRIS